MQTKQYAYKWLDPEVVLSAAWAGEDALLSSYRYGQTSEDAHARIFKCITGSEVSSDVDTLLISELLKKVFIDHISFIYPKDIVELFFKSYPKLDSFFHSLIGVKQRTITNRELVLPLNLHVFTHRDVIRESVHDLIHRHIADMDVILKKHLDGKVAMCYNNLFIVTVNVDCPSCEIDNLVYTGSKFHIHGIDVQMIPSFIS